MEWEQVLAKKPLLLHLGGASLCHPHPRYQQVVSVDIKPLLEGWTVQHDLRQPLPLPDCSVDGIQTEDFVEHIDVASLERLLVECYRLLKPGGRIRIGCPDYDNPKDRPFQLKGVDDRYPGHITLTTRRLLEPIFQRSPFETYHFYQYWQGDHFIQEPVDYSYGWINRTPENDPRCNVFRESESAHQNYKRLLKVVARDTLFMLRRRFRPSNLEFNCQPGHPLFITSLVVDVIKAPASS